MPPNHDQDSHEEVRLRIDRPALTVDELHSHCSFDPPKQPAFKEQIYSKAKNATKCSSQKVWDIITSRVPILHWLRIYNVKEWLMGDLVAGITIAIMQIPLGMAFALLAYLPPICGIYMAFYQVIIYSFFGTSQHCSMGAFGVTTIMTGKVVKDLATFTSEASDMSNMTMAMNSSIFEDIGDTVTYTPVQIATIVSLMVGIWNLIFGILQLGSLSVFCSDMLVSGFTTACAFHVLTSLLPDMFGISIPGISGPMKIIYIYIEIFKALPQMNLATVLITVVAIICLVLSNEIIKPFLSKYTKIPLPSDAIVVIIATLASKYGHFNSNYDVKIVNNIPTGLPPAEIPPLQLMGRVAVDSLVIAIVAFAIDFSLAKFFALRKGYKVDATQEFYAHGLCNIGGSFFSCAPMTAAMARSLIQESAGGVTQVTGFISCGLLLVILLFIGPFFEPLPNAILSTVIVVALKGMFLQVLDFKRMWSISRIDAMQWLVSCLAVIIIDIDWGLIVGVIFSLFVLLAKNQAALVLKIGQAPGTDLFLDMESYMQARSLNNTVLLKIIGSIHFANREYLRQNIISKSHLNPTEKMKELSDKKKNLEMGDVVKPVETVDYLVLDLSGISYIDSAGTKFIRLLKTDYEKAGIILCLAGTPESVLDMLSKTGVLEEFSKTHLFHSFSDAVTIIATKTEKTGFGTRL